MSGWKTSSALRAPSPKGEGKRCFAESFDE
jgi:hypothetical protein